MRGEKQVVMSDVVRDERAALYRLREEHEVGLDLETSGLSPWRDTIAVVSLYGPRSGCTAVLHVRGYLSVELRNFLSMPDKLWVGHNVAGFDMLFLALSGVKVFQTHYFDTMVAEQVTLSTGRRDVRQNLQDTVERRLGVHLKKGQGTSSWMADELSDEQLQYCASDVNYLLDLKAEQMNKVEGTTQANAMEFEQRLLPVIARIVLNGIPLDVPALTEWRKQMVIDAANANAYLHSVRPGLNVNSAPQIKAAFVDLHDVELPSTNKATLADIAVLESGPGELARALQIAKRERKRGTFYDDDWVAQYQMSDGNVHPKFWQASTDTFRFSSSDPNMQQVPKEGRKIFGGRYGYSIVSMDYQQLEVRVAAFFAKDQALIQALREEDIHRTIAAGIFSLPADQISEYQRKLAKSATFVLLFGGGAKRLVGYAKLNGARLTDEQAKGMMMSFFGRFRGVAAMKARATELGKQGRAIPLILASGAKRVLVPNQEGIVMPTQILNTIVQSSAAIGMKHAILNADAANLTQYIGLTVHDELVGSVPNAYAEEFGRELRRAMISGMENVIEDTPMGVDLKIGTHWQ